MWTLVMRIPTGPTPTDRNAMLLCILLALAGCAPGVPRTAGTGEAIPAPATDSTLRARASTVDSTAAPVRLADAAQEAAVSDPLVVGAILPVTGSPSSREYARLFLEGVEVALAEARRDGFAVELIVEDNLGTPSGSVRSLSALVARGASVILGPLTVDALDAVARAAPADIAFLSPTAARLPTGRTGVYSMGMGDPGAGRALARALIATGHTHAVTIHPARSAQIIEADAFAESFRAAGGIVPRQIVYSPGTTTFEAQLDTVRTLHPGVLVVIAPPEDIELLAPQISFYELDDLGLQVAGTAGWTASSVLESVAARHTDSVIAVSTLQPGDAPGFVAAYEQYFRRTLRSPVPAAGFDLFRLAVDAWQRRAPRPGGIIAAMAATERFAGATGTWSFGSGRLVREFHPVRIRNRALHPLFVTDPPSPAAPDTVRLHPDRADRAPGAPDYHFPGWVEPAPTSFSVPEREGRPQ